MRAAIAIVKKLMITVLRQKSTIVFMFVMPIIFTFLFGVAPYSDTRAPIAVVNQDGTKVASAVVEALNHDHRYHVSELSRKTALEDAKNGSIGFILTIPKGAERAALDGKPLRFEVTPSPSLNTYGNGQSDALNQLQVKLQLLAEDGHATVVRQHAALGTLAAQQAFIQGVHHAEGIKSPVTVTTQLFQDGSFQPDISNGQHSVIGFAVMFIMFSVFSMTGTIFTEKKLGTWERFKASPMPHASILTGYGIGFFVMGWLQFMVLYLSGRILFGVALPMNTWMVLAVSLYILAVIGIALCVSGIVRSIEQHIAIGSFISIATCMVGGAYWPVEIEPLWMQHVAWFVPQDWAMSALKMITLGTAAAPMLIWPLVVLAGFAAIFFSAGMVQLKYS